MINMPPRKNFPRAFFLFSMLIVLLAGVSTPAFIFNPVSAAPKRAVSPGDVVISEFRTRGPVNASDEFVELYNPKNAPVDISGLLIRGSNNSGSVGNRFEIPSIPTPTILQPGQYYLIVGSSYGGSTPGESGAVLTTGTTDDGGFALTLADGITMIDQVGMSTGSAYKEGNPLTPLSGSADQSYERKGGGCTDTGDNSSDFVLRTSSNPQNTNSTIALCTDFSLSMTVDNPTPAIGANVIFTLTLTNGGPNAATNVTVKDVLPSGLNYFSDNGVGAYNSGTGIWTVGSLNSGSNVVLTITATVANVGTKTNWAEVWSSDQVDPDSIMGNSSTTEDDDASAVVTPPAGSANLSLTLTSNTQTPAIGDNVVFTITVSNAAGLGDATNLQVKFKPAGLNYVSDNSGGAYNSAAGIWNAGTLASNTSKSIKITENVVTGDENTYWAEVWFVDQTDPNSTPGNTSTTEDDDASVTITPSSQQADLSLTQTWSKASPGVAGTVTFTITVNNAGPNSATNVEVRDVLPSGLSYVSNDLGAAYNRTSGIWTVGTIASGDHKILKITAKILSSGTKTNWAEVWQSDQFDITSIPGNSSTTEDDDASQMPEMVDLSLLMSMSNVAPNVGTDVSFTLKVNNADDFDDATSVKVKDLIPSSYTYVSYGGDGIYTPADGIWDVGTLVSGTTKTLTITATVNSATLLSNQAEVFDVTQVDIDSVPNNSASVKTEDDYASAPAADLNLTQSVSNVNPNVGDNVDFSITVNNAGVGGTTNVQVKDILPTGLTYVSNDQGTAYVSSTGIWSVGTLANGASKTLKITAKVATNGIKTNWAEVWKSDQPDPDSHVANGSTTEDDDASATLTSYRSIVINEIAWGGTSASATDEWIELYNPSAASIDINGWRLKSASGSLNIVLSGTIKAGDYFLLERDDNNTVSDVTADQIYTGALADTGEVLLLCDNSSNFIDTANQEGANLPNKPCQANIPITVSANNPWVAGSKVKPFGTMERQGSSPETDKVWATNAGNPKYGKDASNELIYGTPKKFNSTGSKSSTSGGTTKTPTPGPKLSGRLIINEFLARPGFDWNQDGRVDVFDEFIEIKNVGAADISLSGWKLDDEGSIGSAPFSLPAVTLKPGGHIVFYGLTTNILLGDGGDSVRLLNSSNQVLDSYTYNIAKVEDRSTCRLPDDNTNEFGFGLWYEDCVPTPNLTNTREGTVPSMPDGETSEPFICSLPDTLPADFLFAECRGYGSDIWNTYYWDLPGWQGERYIPENLNKWESFVK